MIKQPSCNLPYLDRKDHPVSRHGKIEQCLQLMKKSGRRTFAAKDVENATDVESISVTRILVFTEGVDRHISTNRRPWTTLWYFTGEPINVPIPFQKTQKWFKGVGD